MQQSCFSFTGSLQIASIALSLASQVLAAPSASPRTYPTVTWRNCTAADPPNLQCGHLQVPVDYNNPHGHQFDLTFARLKASNSTSRLGSLVFNPGGPGGAASRFVFTQVFDGVTVWSPEILADYDIIGLDPRGTGLSNPMTCDQNIWNERVSSTPKNENEFNQLVAHNKAFSESCRHGTGPVFDFMDTTSAAKDMEMVRRALGEEKLNYLGLSYGSQLGSTYAGLYPKNVGRMVLDGVLDVAGSDTQALLAESTAYESTLDKFFQWCNTTTDCALHGQDAAGIFDNLINTANDKPIPAPGCSASGPTPCRSDATGEEILSEVQGGLVGVDPGPAFEGWPALSVSIAEASQGNASLISTPIITAPTDASFSFLGVVCKDWAPTSKSYIDLDLKRQMTSALAPHSRGSSQTYETQSSCIGWVSPATNTRHVLDPNQVAKLPPILLVNALWDPSTSIAWANALRLEIPSSVLILRNGAGHTSYFIPGQTSAAINAYLLTGDLPAQGTTFDS